MMKVNTKNVLTHIQPYKQLKCFFFLVMKAVPHKKLKIGKLKTSDHYIGC